MGRARILPANSVVFDVWSWLGERMTLHTCAISAPKYLHWMTTGFQAIPDDVGQRVDAVYEARLTLEKHMTSAEAQIWFTTAQEVRGVRHPIRPCDLVRRGDFVKVTELIADRVSQLVAAT